jgi:transmembrane sensor
MMKWSGVMGTPESAGDLRSSSPKAMASYWYAVMRSDKVPGDIQADFQRWLAESQEHRALYDSIGNLWGAAREVADHPQILALRHEMAIQLTRRNSRWSQASFRVAIAAAVTAVAVGLAVMFDMPGWMSGKGRYSTDVGERIEVTLPDQSQMTLNTQTRIRTMFTELERRVVLTEGQALFEVAKDPQRPFVVEAGGREFYAVGTAFDLRIRGDQIQVTLVEGAVKVPANTSGAKAVYVRAGDQLTVGRTSPDPTPWSVGDAGVARAISWRDGRVIFEETLLSEVVAEMNRYSEQKISLASPDLGRYRLSGAFVTGKTQAFVETATVYFPVEVARQDRRGIVLKARE